MSGVTGNPLDASACALRLHRFQGDTLRSCEAVTFAKGREGVRRTLELGAAFGARVEIGGAIANHFADVLDQDGDMVQTVALNAASYSLLKNKWMRCRQMRPATDGGDNG